MRVFMNWQRKPRLAGRRLALEGFVSRRLRIFAGSNGSPQPWDWGPMMVAHAGHLRFPR
jgi:hypothetical protein